MAKGQDQEGLGAFTVADFRKRYGIGLTKLYEEIAAGRLRAVKLGRRTMILFSDARMWEQSLPAMR